jgi:hypothetical protein
MSGQMQRNTLITKVAVGTVVADSAKIPFGNHSGGQVYVPSGSTITTITWYGSHDGVTFTEIQDGSNNAIVSLISASLNCAIPAACFACAFLKAVGDAAGTIDISLKS